MSLKELANQTLEEFNPATDDASTQDNEGLPEGEYDVVLNSIQFQVFDSGYECIAADVEVLVGDEAGQHEFININLDPEFVTSAGVKLYEQYPFMLKQNIKYISQIAFAVGVELDNDDWEDMVSLAEAFHEQEAKGSQFILEIKKSQNKAKTKEYTNYVFAKYADEEVETFEAETAAATDISDDDVPF